MNTDLQHVVSDYEMIYAEGGLMQLTDWTTLYVSGKDHLDFIQSFCTNHVKKLQVFESCEAFFLNVKGRIICQSLIIKQESALTLMVPKNQSQTLFEHLNKYIIMEDVSLNVQTETDEMLLFVRPEKFAIDSAFTSCEAVSATWKVNLAEKNDLDLRTTFISVPKTHSERLIQILTASGAGLINQATWEMIRISQGLPKSGVDYSEKHGCQEVDRNLTAISFTKGCYLGQEIVARIDAVGQVNKLLRGIRFAFTPEEGEQKNNEQKNVLPVAVGNPILVAEKEAGVITSVTFSADQKSLLALAYIKKKYSDLDTPVSCNGLSGTLVSLPMR